MIYDYQYVVDVFKKKLHLFRFKLLISDLLKGWVILTCSVLFLLFFHSFCRICFELSIGWKTVYYYFFILVVFAEFFYFVLYPVVRFLLSFSLRNRILFRQVLKYQKLYPDVFVSVYDLAFQNKHIQGDEQLKQAAFVQKYNFLVGHSAAVHFQHRLLFRKGIVLCAVFLLFFLNGGYFSTLYDDLCDYKTIAVSNQLSFTLLNSDLNVEYGKSFRLKLDVKSDDYVVDRVFICFGGGEFLMAKEDSVFVYDFEMINNDIRFNFKALNQESGFYSVKVLPTPVITSYKVTSFPPAYTKMKPETHLNTVDFRLLYGSVLKFELSVSDLDSLYLERNDRFSPVAVKDPKSVGLSLNVRESGEYALYGSNGHFSKKNLLNFTISCIPDVYPGIQVSELQDSSRRSVHYFYGVLTDDYGFSALRFVYLLNNGSQTVIPIPFSPQLNQQEFYFSFDFAEFAGMDRANISYYFEVFDNDNISGPKSSRSDQQHYLVPDLNTIFEYNVEAGNSVNSSLKEAEKLAKEIVTGVKELQKKMLDNNSDHWEKQQLSKDIVEKKNKLDKLLGEVKENNLKKSDLNKNFAGQDSLLMEKQKQIQDLLDKVMDEDMKNLMKEFSKLSEEFSKDKFKNLDEKMKLSFEQMTEELDRNIELLKRFQLEEHHDLIEKQLEKLKSGQEKFDQALKNKALSKDSLSSLSKELKQNMDHISENYKNVLKENQELAEPYSLKDFNSDLDQLSEKMDRQEKESGSGQKNSKLSEEIKKEIDELSEELEQQQQQNFMNQSLPDKDIELIIQNILILSLAEEDLLKEFSVVDAQSLKYNELGKRQDLKRQEYKIVKDSLSALAKTNLMLASLLNHKFYDIELKFGLLPQLIQNNKRGELLREQQFIINYLNDMALSLTDALQKERKSSDGSDEKDGDKKNSKPGKNGEGKNGGSPKDGGYGQMKKFQNSLKKQLEDLVSKMKNGEKGKPLQQGISNMIRENELFRKSLSDFMNESGSMSNAEKQLLNEINQLLDENIKDLANYSVSNQLINRNNLIYNKLIISEKASKEREEYEEKRKSESASDVQYKRPESAFSSKKKSSMIKSDFQKSGLQLNDYFKLMYNNYYIKLGNE